MSSPIPKKTDDQIVDHLRQLKNTKLEGLITQAPEIAQKCCANFQDPSYQTAEVLRKGYEEFKHEVLEEFKDSKEKSLAQMYLNAEAKRSFSSPSLEQKIEQRLIESH